MQFVDADTVHRLLDYRLLTDALEEAHRGEMPLVDEAMLAPPQGQGVPGEGFLILPAWSYGSMFGVKMVTVLPTNATKPGNHPSIQAVYQLFDGDTGAPTATLDGDALTLRKTAADSALGTRFLARRDPHTLLMVGAGELAPHLIRAHVSERPTIGRVLIWNRNPDRAAAVAQDLLRDGIPAQAAGDREAAAREADIISCATMSTEPLVLGDWLKPGAHLDLVGGYQPNMREADDEAARISSVFVNARRYTLGRAGDITQPIDHGVITEADVLADHFDTCRGTHPGRTSDDEITYFKNAGGAHLDLFTAAFLLEQLEAAGT